MFFVSFQADAYIGLGPLLPVVGSFLIFLFVVLIAVIGVLGYPIKRLVNALKKNHRTDDSDQRSKNQKELNFQPRRKITRQLNAIAASVTDNLAEVETLILRRRLPTEINKPIFICGLARSNTTLLTHILNSHPETGSFLYRDLPFPAIPYFWSFFNSSYYRGKSIERRIHRDAIWVDPNSPDAFEEIIWKKNLSGYFDGKFCESLDQSYDNPRLESALRESIRKILLVRGDRKLFFVRKRKARYISKGNYNLFRLKYILKFFPDSRFILCIRNPIDQSLSMARVHQEFIQLGLADQSFGKKLNHLGHFEFGPNRKPLTINPDGSRITEAYWAEGEDYKGYLQQWIDVYSFVLDNYLSDDNLGQHILVVDHEKFFAEIKYQITQILEFCRLKSTTTFLEKALEQVSNESRYEQPTEQSDQEKRAQDIYAEIVSRGTP